MTRAELKEKANDLPLTPGVYLMMDKTGKVIYVGKAKKLKNRVSQYFQDSAAHTAKTRQMVSQVDHFDTIFVSSEFEALVLENSLIKRHMPRYNILLKDDKGYPFVRLSRERYPRFSLVNRITGDGARYFGPFGGRFETRQALDGGAAGPDQRHRRPGKKADGDRGPVRRHGHLGPIPGRGQELLRHFAHGGRQSHRTGDRAVHRSHGGDGGGDALRPDGPVLSATGHFAP